jgi:hypothetical protein
LPTLDVDEIDIERLCGHDPGQREVPCHEGTYQAQT